MVHRGGDALRVEDIEAAFKADHTPMEGIEPDFDFVTGVDLGLKRDCSAVVTLAVGRHRTAEQGRVKLAANKLWRPTFGAKVDLTAVEQYLLELNDQYRMVNIGFDPWQAELLAQRMELYANKRRIKRKTQFSAKPWMKEIPPRTSEPTQTGYASHRSLHR